MTVPDARLEQALLSTLDDEGDQGDPEDELEETDRRQLHAALERSREDVKAGRVHDAGEILAELASRHPR